jgi:hypothetical protein
MLTWLFFRRLPACYRCLILCLLYGGCGPFSALGQTAPWQWQLALQSTGGNVMAQGSTSDAEGNIFVVGDFQGQLSFAPLAPLTSAGNTDVFVAKFDAQTGQCVWLNQAGGRGYDSGYAIALTPTGEVLITGGCQLAPVAFGSLPALTPDLTVDMYVAKLNSQTGAWIWAVSPPGGGGSQAQGRAIASDKAGNAIVAGDFTDSFILNGTLLTGSVFLASFNGTTGQVAWSLSASAGNRGFPLSLAVDEQGGILVAGTFYGGAYFSPQVIIEGINERTGSFVAKAAGNPVRWQWASGATAASATLAGLALDQTGNSVVTGQFEGEMHLGITPGQQPERTLLNSSPSRLDCFVAKLDSRGHFLWATAGGGPQYDVGKSVVVDDQGDIYAAGAFGGDAQFGPSALQTAGGTVYVGKLSGQTGQWLSATQTQSASLKGAATTTGLSLQPSGKLVLTGWFQGRLSIGGDLLSAGENFEKDFDTFIAALEPRLPTVTALQQAASPNRMQVYPNPARGQVRIHLNQPATVLRVRLTTILGKVVEIPCPTSQRPTAEATFSLVGVTPGLYVVEVSSQHATYYQRLVVE